MLFMRELLKYTAPSHPDYELLRTAAVGIQELTQQLDDKTARVKDQQRVKEIHEDHRGLQIA
jgi:hypothetical protein